MNRIYNNIVLALLLIGFSSCEDVIELDLADGESQYVIDALINDEAGQVIVINKSAPYFSNETTPDVSGAEVFITNNLGETIVFEDIGEGQYRNEETLAGAEDYTLHVKVDGLEFIATSSVNAVPPIDSVYFQSEESPFTGELETFGLFDAVDIPGESNFYWIEHMKGDSISLDATDITISQDGAFTGDGSDGFVFILPIRGDVNDFEYEIGDTLFVELKSITEECFNFLNDVVIQASNADAGLFAVQPANVRSNMINVDEESDVIPLGFFCVSRVSRDFRVRIE